MDTVIVAFENDNMSRQFGDLLENNGIARCLICHSGDQVRRSLSRQPVYCVVCGAHLTDGPAEWLAEDLPPFCSMLVVGPQHVLDACGGRDIYKLATPIRREEALCTVRLLLQFGRRMERLLRPRRSPGEREVVERAKALIMERKGIGEDEAHRLLQKRSMDEGARLIQTARKVIQELEK